MNDQELERKLHAALEHAAPDDVEAVLARLGPQNGEIIPISAPKRRKRILPWIAAACLALAIGGGVAGVRYQQANAVASVPPHSCAAAARRRPSRTRSCAAG